jgi:hypothetical protein
LSFPFIELLEEEEEETEVKKVMRLRRKGRRRKKPADSTEPSEDIENSAVNTRRSNYPFDCPHCSILISDRKAKVLLLDRICPFELKKSVLCFSFF